MFNSMCCLSILANIFCQIFYQILKCLKVVFQCICTETASKDDLFSSIRGTVISIKHPLLPSKLNVYLHKLKHIKIQLRIIKACFPLSFLLNEYKYYILKCKTFQHNKEYFLSDDANKSDSLKCKFIEINQMTNFSAIFDIKANYGKLL